MIKLAISLCCDALYQAGVNDFYKSLNNLFCEYLIRNVLQIITSLYSKASYKLVTLVVKTI